MKSADVRKKFIEFYKARGHVEIPSAPLVPENDPTTLFISAGMQPLIQNILGTPHPSGKRLVNSQKCFRAGDIDEVGDNRHSTYYEMLGNWSLGDYFKTEQLSWLFEFLTKELHLDPKRFYITVFEGNTFVPKDNESIKIWKDLFSSVGIDAKIADNASSAGARIFTYPASKNWWSRSGEPEYMPVGEPGGPDSEVFYDFGLELKFHEKSPYKDSPCHPNCDCGRHMEICNSVFMQYIKKEKGKRKKENGEEKVYELEELSQKNVDFGGGLERLVAATENTPDVFSTDLFTPIITMLEEISGKKYKGDKGDRGDTGDGGEVKAMRIIADHMKGAVMMIADGVVPSNKTQGYVLRRLIRRSLLFGKKLGMGNWGDLVRLVEPVAEIYRQSYPEVLERVNIIKQMVNDEVVRFGKTLDRGLAEIEKLEIIDGKKAFMLYETYGFPWEMTEEIARDKGQTVNRAEFEAEFKKHQELSRTATRGMFKGGLADRSLEVTKLHTATHLLHEALHRILGDHVQQKGSNITTERLRFDFSHPAKVTADEIKAIEELVNQKIQEDLPVSFEIMDKEAALKSGARAFFDARYGEKVKVYAIGEFSREICGGPHVSFTGEVGHFTIVKEESAGAGIRRLYASVSPYEATVIHSKHPQP